jgi:hypothetical protein
MSGTASPATCSAECIERITNVLGGGEMSVAHRSFDAEPAEALEAVRAFSGPVLVDLDETLFLRNSTEEFLNCAVPGLAALVLLRVFDILRPWQWTGGDATRDVWRVRLVVLLFPWTLVRWRRRVGALAAQHCNRDLAQAVTAGRKQPIIVTVGFDVVVKPLVRALGFGACSLVAARLFRIEDRRRGKLAMASAALGDDLLSRSLCITDSIDDLPLLRVCARPLRVIWPGSQYRRALAHVYLPGMYVALVRYPGQRYIFRGILQEDFALWFLASIALASNPVLHAAGLLLLVFSFWAIYERGYVDNDIVAARYETDPKLSASFWSAQVATPTWQPWIWATVAGVVAIPLLRNSDETLVRDGIIWVAWLAFTYGWFWFYSRCDKATRIWLYGGLQFFRSAAFLTLASTTSMGLLAVAAHVSARWFPYLVYRLGRQSWPALPIRALRLLLFVTFAALLLLSSRSMVHLDATAVLLLAWFTFQARRELRSIWEGAVRIDVQDKKNA